tara:strand:- start:860 stop:1111 length:252 start_codon:yes stop_codon:yes gene_type:complete
MTMKKTPKKIIKEMALIYEKSWNEHVASLPQWKKQIITGHLEVDDNGHHIYSSRRDQDIANEAAKQARRNAEEIIYAKYNGKY